MHEPDTVEERWHARPTRGDALLLVDIQRDFLPGGALAVAEGDRVVAPAERCAAWFARHGMPVFASRDWHPRGHVSFRERGGTWPAHCVAGTAGAGIAASLPVATHVVDKGTDPDRDAYSAFAGTTLAAALRAAGVTRLFVAGLATDYCVLHSVLDALALGLRVTVLADAVAAVDVKPGDGQKALERMRAAGAEVDSSAALLRTQPA